MSYLLLVWTYKCNWIQKIQLIKSLKIKNKNEVKVMETRKINFHTVNKAFKKFDTNAEHWV
jgi:hypothetical protein